MAEILYGVIQSPLYFMAGTVIVDDDVKEGTVNIRSSDVDTFFNFLKECKLSSSILKAEEGFQPELDQNGVLGATNCIIIDQLSDAALAEIHRLLLESLQPNHVFWEEPSNYSDYSNPFFKERLIKMGIDVNIKLNEIKTRHQAAFRSVADAIQRRLERR